MFAHLCCVWSLFSTFLLQNCISPLLHDRYSLHRSYGRLRLPAGLSSTSGSSPLNLRDCSSLNRPRRSSRLHAHVSSRSPASLTPVDLLPWIVVHLTIARISPAAGYSGIGVYNFPFRGSICSTFRLPARVILCLRFTHVVASMCPRLDTSWVDLPLSGKDFHLQTCAPNGARNR